MSRKRTKKLTPVFIGNLFYAPTISYEPVICTNVDDSFTPIYIEETGEWYEEDGCINDSANPILFPYTQEYYDKLITIYSNIEPYKEAKTINYNSLCEQLLKIVDTILVKQSDASFENAIDYDTEPKMESDISYYKFNVPVNPFTYQPCKTVNDYFEINETLLTKING